MSETHLQADYGIDAPAVVRNLFAVGVFCLIGTGSVVMRAWDGHIRFPVGGETVDIDFLGTMIVLGVFCTAMACWLLWDSLVGKLRGREQLLDRHVWRGDERVLDIGCGRGLLLIGAAHRLTTGRAIGIDIWQSEDLSGNHREATEENARREGVFERIELQTADMREMPFADGSFDVIVSRAAIHNIYDEAGRARAIAEIARVLKPGGRALIEDIRHQRQYAAAFAAAGCAPVTQVGSRFASAAAFVLSFGSLLPGSLVVDKPR